MVTFFEPVGQGVPAYSEDTFDAAHTRTFVIGSHNLLFLGFIITDFGYKHGSFITGFAPVLLLTLGIMAVFDDIGTLASPTLVSNRFLDHTAYFTVSLCL